MTPDVIDELGLDATTAIKVTYPHAHPFLNGWIPNRLDMGFDGNFKERIYAPVAGEIIYAGIFNGWNGSHGVILNSDADLGTWVPTNCLYWTEGVRPIVHSGQHVKAGQAIAVWANSPYGNSYGHGALGAIEWGVATHGSVGAQTNAYAITLGIGSPEARRMVLRFAYWAEHVLGTSPPTQTSNAGSP